MPSEDFTSYAKSSVDFYALLSIAPESSQKELDRAWRKTALKYHPDKVGAKDISAREKFHLAQIGYDLLSDPTSKQIYDNARTARLQRQKQHEQYEGRRRQMKEELEKRERGEKRTWDGASKMAPEDDLQSQWDRELDRIAKDGARRRKEREEALRREIQRGKAEEEGTKDDNAAMNGTEQRRGVSEVERTVQVRWAMNQSLPEPKLEEIESLFAKFGEIESAIIFAEPKPMRLKGSKKKQMGRQCVLMYKSIVGAHAAVEDFVQQDGPEWAVLDSVRWALGKEPEILSSHTKWTADESSAKQTPPPTDGSATPGAPRRFNGTEAPQDEPRDNTSAPAKPSFGSFSASAKATPISTSFAKGLGAGGPTLEEMTLIRLRKLEQKRLAAEIERQEKDFVEVNEAATGNGKV